MYIILSIAVIVLFYGFILSQVAKLLGAVLNLPNSILVAYKNRNKSGFIKAYNKLQINDALNTDIFLHRNLRTLWNFSLSSNGWKFKRVGYVFGTKGETLSSAIGHKFEERSLSFIGYVLYYALFIIDVGAWFKGGHCKVAYDNYKERAK